MFMHYCFAWLVCVLSMMCEGIMTVGVCLATVIAAALCLWSEHWVLFVCFSVCMCLCLFAYRK